MKITSHRSLARYAVMQLEKGSSWSTIAKQIAAELVASNRTKQIPRIVSEIAHELERQQLLVSVQVFSAKPLSRRSIKKIEDFIKASSKVENVSIDLIVEPKLISGMRIVTPSRTWDMSGQTMLQSLSNSWSVA